MATARLLKHTGSWQDSPNAAINTAMAEVNLYAGEYIECVFSDGVRYEPLDSEKLAVDVEVVYSTTREQYKAILRQTFSHLEVGW